MPAGGLVVILFDFQYEKAQSLTEAAGLLAGLGQKARLMAGGTDLLPNMRVAVTRPATVIGLGGIAPAAPQIAADGSLRIDALTRLSTLVESDLVRERWPMLAKAAHAVGSQQIREMGTLGGNLCQETRCLYFNQKHDFQFVEPCYKREGACCYPFPQNKPDVCWSVYMSDVAPALIALGAEIDLIGEGKPRRMPLEQLYSGNGLAPFTLKGGDVIEAVWVPAAAAGSGFGYHKLSRRGGLEFATAVAAVALRLDADGACSEIRIVIGAVRERPVRATAAEQALLGSTLDDGALAAAAKAVAEVNPLPHHGFTKSYIVDSLRVYLRRVLTQAVDRARANLAA
jgi:4-hydroxybenzoyl-CoA reductase beta subunit